MSTPAMTLPEAIRAAGATYRPGLHIGERLWHCNQPMATAGQRRYHCTVCQIAIERADTTRPANPAPGQEDALWIVTQRQQGTLQP